MSRQTPERSLDTSDSAHVVSARDSSDAGTKRKRSWRGLGQDHSRVGGVLVVTDAQKRALEAMARTLGAALSRASRADKILTMLTSEAVEAGRAIDAYNDFASGRDFAAQLENLPGSPLRDGRDFKLLMLRDLARRLGFPEVVVGEPAGQPDKLALHHIVDRVRGLAMQALSGEGQP